MHITKDQFGNIKHILQDRFGDSLQIEETPHVRYDSKSQESIENGTMYAYMFENGGKQFKLEVVEKEKVKGHEKMKEGRIIGRTFESVPGEYVYSLELYTKMNGEWQMVDLHIEDFLS